MNCLYTYTYWKDSGPTSESDFKTTTSSERGGAAKATAKRAANTMMNFILIENKFCAIDGLKLSGD